MAEESSADLVTFSSVEQGAIFGPYARLATPPEGSGEDIGLDFNPHLPPWPITTTQAAGDPATDATELPNLPETPFASPQVPIAHRHSPSPLVQAVDAAADCNEETANIPDSPLDLSHYEIDSRPSFDTSVRDLLQSRPDSPIGGYTAAPMMPITPVKPKRSFNVGTLVVQSGLPPRIEVSCADSEIHCAVDSNRALKSRSRASESQGSENQPLRSELQTSTCGNTPPMVTAPESPRFHSRTNGSDDTIDIDDRRLTVTEVRDFGLSSDGSRSKKASRVPDPEPSALVLSKGDSASDHCEDCVSPLTVTHNKASPKPNESTLHTAKMVSEDAMQAKDLKTAKAAKNTTASKDTKASKDEASKDAKVSKDTKPGNDGKGGKNNETHAKPGTDGKGGKNNEKDTKPGNDGKGKKNEKNAKNAEQAKDSKPTDPADPDFCEDCVTEEIAKKTKLAKEADAAKSVGDAKVVKDANVAKTVQNAKAAKNAKIPPGMPTDATGELPAPATPKPSKGKVAKAKVQMAIRKSRGAMLRTPVLNLVVGRQLGPSTSQALKLIGKGGAVEPPKIVPTVPLPVPA